jgi:hypothetical protein
MVDTSLRREVVDFVSRTYAEMGFVPTVRDLLRRFGRSRDAFYGVFPGGMREICREAGVPIPEERYRAVAKACAMRRKTARASNGSVIGGDAAYLDKVHETDIRNLNPVKMRDSTTAPSPVIVPANVTTEQKPTDWTKWQCEVHGPVIPLRLEPDPGLIVCAWNMTNGQILSWKNLTHEYVRHLLDLAPDAT